MTIPARANDVLELWFGQLDEDGFADEVHTQQWFKKDDAFDERLRRDFGDLHKEIVEGLHEDWLGEPRAAVAYIVVLDQFSRNMFRGTPQMFATDEQAVRAVRHVVDNSHDNALAAAERVFVYMPLMHSEALSDQDRCIAEFERLAGEVPESRRGRIENNVNYAKRHRAIVDRFGRFPHRNAILGRTSTSEEETFLTQPGSSF